jgi:hypothetical protein
MGNLTDMNYCHEMGNSTDESMTVSGYTAVCEEQVVVEMKLTGRGLSDPVIYKRTINA